MPKPTELYNQAVSEAVSAIARARTHRRAFIAALVALFVIALGVGVYVPRLWSSIRGARHEIARHEREAQQFERVIGLKNDSIARVARVAAQADSLRKLDQWTVRRLLSRPPKIDTLWLTDTLHDIAGAAYTRDTLPLSRVPMPVVSAFRYDSLAKACTRVMQDCDSTVAALARDTVLAHQRDSLRVLEKAQQDSALSAAKKLVPTPFAELKTRSKIAAFGAAVGALACALFCRH